MTDDFLTKGLLNPISIPCLANIQCIFSHCLLEAERTFGPRAPGWEYTVQLRQHPLNPETINDGQNQVTVWLSHGRSWVGYFFEAAHEAVHCLNPIVPSGSATYIEEAVATEFSLGVVHQVFGSEGVEKCVITPHYKRARNLASEIDSDLIRLGQILRDCTDSLESVTAKVIEDLYPHAPQQAVRASLGRFPRQMER